MSLPRVAQILVLGALLACLVGPAGASAATAKTPLPKERNLDTRLRIDITTAPGQPVTTTSRIVAWLPKGIRAATEKMPTCSAALISSRGPEACPAKSKVGTGTGVGLVLQQNEQVTMIMFNGVGGELLAYVRGYTPVSINAVVHGKLTKPSGGKYGYGQELDFPLPDGVLYPLPGVVTSLLHVDARLDGKAGWLRSRTCPPHGWSLGSQLTSTTGGILKLAADLSCV